MWLSFKQDFLLDLILQEVWVSQMLGVNLFS